MGFRVDGDALSYLPCGRGFAYLSLTMDTFSRNAECRLIGGWSLQKTLNAKVPVIALKMALLSSTNAKQLLHHSNRGVQYCSWAYVYLLRDENVKISMRTSAEPNKNSIAESFNRTL